MGLSGSSFPVVFNPSADYANKFPARLDHSAVRSDIVLGIQDLFIPDFNGAGRPPADVPRCTFQVQRIPESTSHNPEELFTNLYYLIFVRGYNILCIENFFVHDLYRSALDHPYSFRATNTPELRHNFK